MTLQRLGETRSRRTYDHLLQTPDTFVWAPLPGMQGCTACIHAAPALGAAFTQYTALFEEGGTLGPAVGSRFVFVLEGAVRLDGPQQTLTIEPDGYAYLPSGIDHSLRAVRAKARIAVIEKRYSPEMGLPQHTDVVVGRTSQVASSPLMGDSALQVRTLLPPNSAFDFAVNTMEYLPGASLSMVEVHMMEHGLLMLEGEGIYRLSDSWYPVAQGDFIWMGPYCPQWFGALGKTPAVTSFIRTGTAIRCRLHHEYQHRRSTPLPRT